jgi:hypothetical protein
MTKPIIKNKKIKINPVDFFNETSFEANTVNKINTIHEEPVESKIVVKDTYYPTFVIVRKQYCLHCWLKRINS